MTGPLFSVEHSDASYVSMKSVMAGLWTVRDRFVQAYGKY